MLFSKCNESMRTYIKNAVKRWVVKSRLKTNDPKLLNARRDRLLQVCQIFEDKLRQLHSLNSRVPAISSFNGKETLGAWIMNEMSPWKQCPIEPVETPGMISSEESQYYAYIGRFYSGVGEAVELGPWLGRSTHFILKGLKPNPNFKGKKLFVFDDFVWRASWMNPSVNESEQLQNHQCFRPLFEKYTADIQSDIQVERSRIVEYDGNSSVAPLAWCGKPIELLYVDCGRTYAVNDGWYSILKKSFIPNRTLIIMQDWRLHREIPVKWYNQTKQFTDSKDTELDLIHEVKDGGVATFIYRG